jgi:hypothetical protein
LFASRMTGRPTTLRLSAFTSLLLAAVLVPAGSAGAARSKVETFVLSGVPDPSVQRYRMRTQLIHVEPDGQRTRRETYTLWLQLTPGPGGDSVTCRRFLFQPADGPAVTLPAFERWSYWFGHLATGVDEKRQIFGIDQGHFEKLVDEKGAPLPVDAAYAVFNAFVDFHSLGQVFCAPGAPGHGIQDLHRIGDRIVHFSAGSKAPVHMGSLADSGSTFENGQVTLALKGTSVVTGSRCALLAFDSGESSFHMTVHPVPGMAVDVVGGSHYWGDLYVDLATQWLRKATMSELVVSETSGAVLPQKLHGVIERRIELEPVGREEFEAAE